MLQLLESLNVVDDISQTDETYKSASRELIVEARDFLKKATTTMDHQEKLSRLRDLVDSLDAKTEKKQNGSNIVLEM